MDEEVLQDLFDRAVAQGYPKSIEEFSVLLSSDEEVLNDNFVYVKEKGYPKSIEEFAQLVGAKKKEEVIADDTVSVSEDGSVVAQQEEVVEVAQPQQPVVAEDTQSFSIDGVEVSQEEFEEYELNQKYPNQVTSDVDLMFPEEETPIAEESFTIDGIEVTKEEFDKYSEATKDFTTDEEYEEYKRLNPIGAQSSTPLMFNVIQGRDTRASDYEDPTMGLGMYPDDVTLERAYAQQKADWEYTTSLDNERPSAEVAAAIDEVYGGTLLEETSTDSFERLLSNIDSELIDYSEEYVVPKLNEQFRNYGFSFEETWYPGDAMYVTAPDGVTTQYIDLDTFSDSGDESQAKILKDFLINNKPASFQEARERVVLDEEEIKATVKIFNSESEAFKNKTNDFMARYVANQEAIEALETGSFPGAENQAQREADYLAAMTTQAELGIEMQSLKEDEDVIKYQGRRLDRIAGRYVEMQSQQGTWGGGIWNSMVEGVSSLPKMAVRTMTTVGSEIQFAFQSDATEAKFLREQAEDFDIDIPDGLSPAEVIQFVKDADTGTTTVITPMIGPDGLERGTPMTVTIYPTYEKMLDKAKDVMNKEILYGGRRSVNPYSQTAARTDMDLGMIDAVDEGMREYFTSGNTTEQWENMKKEGFWGGAVLGLAQSLPLMIGANNPLGWAQRTAQFYALSTESVYEEMEQNPDFADITETEKMKVTAPIGIAIAVLETYGLRNLTAKSPVVLGFVSRAINKSTAQTTAKTFGELIENDVKSRGARFGLTVAGGASAEFETGLMQEVAETKIKDIYNDIKGKDFFETPDTWGEYLHQTFRAGAQEAVGGGIISTVSGVATASSNGELSNVDETSWGVFREMISDPEYKLIYVTSLKQQIAAGEITAAEARARLESVNQIIGDASQVPSTFTPQQQQQAISLIQEKRKLEEAIDGKDKSLTGPEQAQIAAIQEQLVGIANAAAAPEIATETEVEAAVATEAIVEEEAEGTRSTDDLIDRARDGDVDAQETLNEYGIPWEKESTYRFIGESEVEALDKGETIKGKSQGAGVDITTSEEVTTATDAEYRVTFKEEGFDNKREGTRVRMKNDKDGWIPGGYNKSDVAKIEKLNADGTYETVYEAEVEAEAEAEVEAEAEAEGDTEVKGFVEGVNTTTLPVRVFKGDEGKEDLEGQRINAHQGVEGDFTSTDVEVAQQYAGEVGVSEVVLPEGTTIEVVEVDGKGKTLSQFREAEVEAINNSDAQVVKLITLDGRLKKGEKRNEQYIIKDSALRESLRDPSVDTEVVEATTTLSEEAVPGYDRMSQEVNNIIEKSKKRGVKPAKILDNVIKYIQGSRVYETATDTVREQMVREARKNLGVKEKAAPSTNRLLGVLQDVKKITVKESTALKNRINAEVKAAKGAKDFIAQKQKELADDIRALTSKGQLTQRQSADLIKKFATTDITKPKAVDALVDYVTTVFNDSEGRYRRGILKDISKLIKQKAKTTTQSGKRKGKSVTPEVQRLMSALRRVAKNIIDTSPEVSKSFIESESNFLEENQREIDRIYTKELLEGERLTPKERQLMERQVAFDMLRNALSLNLKDTEALLTSLKDLSAESLADLKAIRRARAQEYQAEEEAVTEQIKRTNPAMFSENGKLLGKEALFAKKQEMYRLWRDKKYPQAIKEFVKSLKGLTPVQLVQSLIRGQAMHLGTLTNLLDKVVEGSNMFTKKVYDRVNVISENYLKGVRETRGVVDEIAESLGFEKGYLGVKRAMAQGTFREKTIDLDIIDKSSGTTVKTSFNLDQLMRIYALSLNDVQRAKLEEKGIDEQTLETIKEELGPELVSFVEEIVKFLSDTYYNEVNDVYSEVNDVDLPFIDNYFPTSTVKSETKTEELIKQGEFGKVFNAETAPALKERADTKGEIILDKSFSDVLEKHIDTMEKFKASAKGVKMLTRFFNVPAVESLLNELFIKETIKGLINTEINPNSGMNASGMTNILDKLYNKYTGYALSFKLIQIAKQATSFINALDEYSFFPADSKVPKPVQNVADFIGFAVDMASLIANLGVEVFTKDGPLSQARKASASFDDRIRKGLEGDVYALESGSRPFRKARATQTTKGRALRGLKSAAGATTAIGDIGGVLGYLVNYRRNIKNGMSPEEALIAFNNYNATQQTRRGSDRTTLQNNSNFAVRYFMMFLSSLILMMNKVMSTSKNLFDSYTNLVEGAKEKDIKKMWQNRGRAKDYRGLVLSYAGANVLFAIASNIFLLLGSDDEDDLEKAYGRILEAMMGLPIVYSIPILGSQVKKAEIGARIIQGEDFKPSFGAQFSSDGVNPLDQITYQIKKANKPDPVTGEKDWAKTIEPIIEIGLGTQIDPAVGLYNILGGEFDDDAMYDFLGVSSSYRPKGEEASGSEKTIEQQNKEYEELMNPPRQDTRERGRDRDRSRSRSRSRKRSR